MIPNMRSAFLHLLKKQNALHLSVFSIFCLSTTSLEHRGIRCKKYFTDYGIAKPMDSFRDSFSVRKMHDSTRRTNFKQYSIPAK